MAEKVINLGEFNAAAQAVSYSIGRHALALLRPHVRALFIADHDRTVIPFTTPADNKLYTYASTIKTRRFSQGCDVLAERLERAAGSLPDHSELLITGVLKPLSPKRG